jgi:hypothetical protein
MNHQLKSLGGDEMLNGMKILKNEEYQVNSHLVLCCVLYVHML